MAESPATLTRRELEARLVARARSDEAFRAELRREPRAAIQADFTGAGVTMRLPDSIHVTVLEETPDSLYLVIPVRRALTAPAQSVLMARGQPNVVSH